MELDTGNRNIKEVGYVVSLYCSSTYVHCLRETGQLLSTTVVLHYEAVFVHRGGLMLVLVWNLKKKAFGMGDWEQD